MQKYKCPCFQPHAFDLDYILGLKKYRNTTDRVVGICKVSQILVSSGSRCWGYNTRNGALPEICRIRIGSYEDKKD